MGLELRRTNKQSTHSQHKNRTTPKKDERGIGSSIPFVGQCWSFLFSKKKRFSTQVIVVLMTIFVMMPTFKWIASKMEHDISTQKFFSSSTSYAYELKDEIYKRLLNVEGERTIPRFHIDDKLAEGMGTRVGPVLLEGWEIDPNAWDKKVLMDRIGDYPQYLKDLTVQPLKMKNKKLCKLKGKDVADLLPSQDLLFFTNNNENNPFMKELKAKNPYKVPSVVKHIDGFEVFSALYTGKYHSMHAHGESWLGQVSGRRVWWFLPPDTLPKPERVDACGYLTGKHKPPPNVMTCTQNPGEIIWFPKDWFHATCALDEWTVGIGAQQGRTIRQNFPKLKPKEFDQMEENGNYDDLKTETMNECLPSKTKEVRKIDFNTIVQKKDNGTSQAQTFGELRNDVYCDIVPHTEDGPRAEFTEITPQLMSGQGTRGGKAISCISGWYCCDKGLEWYDHLDAHRTDNTAFLKLERNLFGHYVDVFAKHLNDYYANYPASFGGGRFLDIGGTGSTASGMKKVTSKFQHFAGPLEYWILDSDQAAKEMERTLFCDIDDCPAAEDCAFDVTFSHTVLEHARRPWRSFDTIARITKKGGLTMHLVPWSYQYHATPDDNYRFSHKALITLLEDRGFDVLDVGYDICTKPKHMKSRVDEHYDIIWLTYVVGRKR